MRERSYIRFTKQKGGNLIFGEASLLLERLGESGARVRTRLPWVRSEPNPMDRKRGQVSRKRMSDGCHSKSDDRPKNCTTLYDDRVERREWCKLASPLGHRTQLWLSPASDSSHSLRFRATQASTPDRDADCESCVAPDSPNLSIIDVYVIDTKQQQMGIQLSGQSAVLLIS